MQALWAGTFVECLGSERDWLTVSEELLSRGVQLKAAKPKHQQSCHARRFHRP
jgi:hypothetical protein